MAQAKTKPAAKSTKAPTRRPRAATPAAAPTLAGTTAVEPAATGKLGRLKHQRLIRPVLMALAVALLGLLVWQYLKARSELRRYNDPATAVEEASRDAVDEVGKVIVLPEGETPTVANINDVTKLADKPFFNNARNGDKLLVYPEAGKAILYRPSSRQIVEVATYSQATSLEPAEE